MREKIQQILQLAVHAPSGHNYQPWRFRIENNTLHLYNIPERDTTLFNFKQRGSLIAHGTVIENIFIASPQYGLLPNITLLPINSDSNHIASITFKESQAQTNYLHEFISKRNTNRKPYKKNPIEPSQMQALLKTTDEIGQGGIKFIQNRQEVNKLANIFTLNEKLVIENFAMHHSLFPHILWNKEENEQKKLGLYIKTFELPPPGEIIFRLLKNWSIARVLSRLGVSKIVMQQNQKLYSSSGAIGLIFMQNNQDHDFIVAGRILQRMWLKATKMGLSIQPLAGLIYLGQRVATEKQEYFNSQQVLHIQRAYQEIAETFNVSPEMMMLTFRIGYDGLPTKHASYLSPNVKQS